MTAEQLDGLKAVAMDMWGPSIQATRAPMPDAAEQIVFDHFHVMDHIGKAIDTVRKQEHRALSWEHVPEQRRAEFGALRRQGNSTSVRHGPPKRR